MKKYIKYVFLFLLFFFLYSLPGIIFKPDTAYYYSLNLPSYAPKPIIFAIVWPVLFIIFSFYLVFKMYKKELKKEEAINFIINYVVLFFFNKVFFYDHQLFLSFTITFLAFSTGLIMFIYAFKEKRLYSAFIIPFLLWSLFASTLMAHIYFIN